MTEKNYAFIKDGIVTNIVVFDDEQTDLLENFKEIHGIDSIVLATENTCINGEYDGNKFWLIKPHPSWVKNEDLNKWQAPIPMPEDKEHKYIWNEETASWTLSPIPESPYPSWIFNNDSYLWEAPTERPAWDVENPKFYIWNEESLSWIEDTE
jgi:hypothetical protein